MQRPPTFSVIIVTYFVREEVRACLAELRRCTVPLEVFVVDNASTDGTREMLAREFSDWDALHVFALDENIGLAAANNVPLARLTGEFVMILNPDTVPTNEALHRIARYLEEHPDVGVVGPKQLYENGVPHSTFHASWGLAHIALLTAVPRGILKFWYDRPARLVQREVAFVSGACLVIRRQIYQAIGGYDPYYFITIEDVADLCRRVRARGHRVMYLPDAVIVHYGARSSSHARAVSLLRSGQGHLYYLRKWEGVWPYRAARLILFVNSLLRGLVYAILAPVNPGRFWPFVKIHGFVMRHLLADLPAADGADDRRTSAVVAGSVPGTAG